MEPGSKWHLTASSTCPWSSRKSAAWVEMPPLPEGSSQDAISCPESGHLSTTMRISSIPNSIEQPITRLSSRAFGLATAFRATATEGRLTEETLIEVSSALISGSSNPHLAPSLNEHVAFALMLLLRKVLTKFEQQGTYAARVLNASKMGSHFDSCPDGTAGGSRKIPHRYAR